MTLPHISDAIRADDSSDKRQEDPGAERLEERAPGLASGQHGAERGDRLRGDDRDAAALPGERERLLVARGIVLADGRERLVLVADEHGGPEVASGPAGGLGGPPQQRLHPGVLEQHADGAGERGVRARGHVEREDLAALDQLAERRQPAPEARHGPAGLRRPRPVCPYIYVWAHPGPVAAGRTRRRPAAGRTARGTR